MDNVNQIFWAGQEVYIMKLFLPIIIGFLVLSVGLVALFALSFWWQHYRLWRLGKDENRFGQVSERLKTLLAVVFANVRIWGKPYPGIMHFLILWGTIFIFLGKIIRLFSYPMGLTNPPQIIFKYASFISEVGGILVLIGGGMAIIRRYILKPPYLDTKPDNSLIFIWGFAIILTGYLIKGFRMAATNVDIPLDWLSWAPLSYLVSRLFSILPSEPMNELLVWHRVLIHAIPGFLFFVYIIVSRSTMQHIFLSPLNIFFRSLKPKGALHPILNFEEGETFGARKIFDFTWKQLLDLEACTICGRCQESCPAYLSQKPLNPKKVILDLRSTLNASPKNRHHPPLAGHSVSEQELWACTTCHACVEACPVFVEHVEKIVDLRRQLVMEEARFPSGVKSLFRNLEIYGDTHGKGASFRTDWATKLPVKKVKEDRNFDILYWAGCEGTFHDRNKEVSKVIVKILQEAGVSVGLLGKEERCCGDPARRIGNEYLFQELAHRNIEVLNHYGIKKIVTCCPHCFNALKNEYPLLGGHFEVIHHSEYIAQLLRQGRLKFKRPLEAVVTFHDPCYLGRVNGIYDAPREMLERIPGLKVKEMKLSRKKSFCCGGGGGRMWMHEHLGQRMNSLRAREAIETGVDLVVTACPFCLTMFEDGMKNQEMEKLLTTQDLTLDLAEILYRSIA